MSCEWGHKPRIALRLARHRRWLIPHFYVNSRQFVSRRPVLPRTNPKGAASLLKSLPGRCDKAMKCLQIGGQREKVLIETCTGISAKSSGMNQDCVVVDVWEGRVLVLVGSDEIKFFVSGDAWKWVWCWNDRADCTSDLCMDWREN